MNTTIQQSTLVSIIIDTYYRPAMLREAVTALRAQTYKNIEIIIVNNGATPETVSYLLELEKEEQRVRLVHFETNQFSWDDPHMIIRVCFNAGLKASKGELIFHQADDDWLAHDFIERMVRLFEKNQECITAIGRCIDVMPDGTLVPFSPAKRSRYMPGHELALDYATGSKKVGQSNPGHCFVMRRDALERNGGFHEAFEDQQMFAIVPFGITGYDPGALMYWRRHELQLNKMANKKCIYWGQYTEMLLSDPHMRVLERWRLQFGEDNSKIVEKFLSEKMLRNYIAVIFYHFLHLRVAKTFNLLLRLRKIDARKYLNPEIIRSGFGFTVSQTMFGRICLLFQIFLRGIVTDPVLTLSKVKRKILQSLS